MARLQPNLPQNTFYKNLEVLFSKDPKIKVFYDEENQVISLYVDDDDKAAALRYVLPKEQVYKDTIIHIVVVSEEEIDLTKKNISMEDIFDDIFDGNSIYVDCAYIKGLYPMKHNPVFVLFKPEIVQYDTDEIEDYAGIHTALYQDIAKEIFKDINGVYFSTIKIMKSDVKLYFDGVEKIWP